MANEFKIKKGLIVTGASGGTVVDIQGSQGQLFSVTDDLSGSIFAVSDISGVPILDVNSSGLVTIDGPFTQTGGGDSNFSGDVNIKSVFDFDTATDLFSITNNQNTGGINLSGNNSRIYFGGNRAIEGAQGGTNLTFAEGYTSSYFQSNVNVTGDVALTGSSKYIYLRTGTNSGLWQEDDFSLRFGTNNIEALELDNVQNATFAAQAFSAATSSGDGSSTLTTKGYVDGLITGATIYRGAWDPSGGGYGSPDLSGVTQTSGYYYICSAAGTAEPNGTGTEPDTWETGDWVIYNDVSGTGQWQKIDNSSVLSGVGTGQTVALWEGAGSVTDSETLGNAPITVSGNDTSFAGDIDLTAGQLELRGDVALDHDGSSLYVKAPSSIFLFPANTNKGNINAAGLLTIAGGGTFGGDITSPTFLGDLNGTINTATTGTTQTAGNNSTLIATTAYADAAAAAVPIGNYLPLSAGASYPLTGTLYGTSTNMSGAGTYAGSMSLGSGAAAAEAHLTIGQGRTGNGYSYIDLVGDATYTDYGLRIIRNNTGANTSSAIIHKGTGLFSIVAPENADIVLLPGTSNVGIGTTSPDQLLHVAKSNAPAGIEIQGGLNAITAVGDVHGFIDFGTNDGSATGGIAGRIESLSETTNGAHNGLAFYTGRQSRTPYLQKAMQIGSTGAISFGSNALDYGSAGEILVSNGNASPSWDAASTVIGGPYLPLTGGTMTGALVIGYSDARLRGGDSTGRFIVSNSDTTSYISLNGSSNASPNDISIITDEEILFLTGAGYSEAMRIASNGNVGIGATSPSERLEVDGNISFGDSHFIGDDASDNLLIQSSANENIIIDSLDETLFRINGSTKMQIKSSGNVGIGTTSPDTKLHVEGNVLIDAYSQGEDNGLFFREGFLTIDQPSITVWDMSNSGASPDGLSINSQDGIRFRENGGEVARFKDGSFGIGTTSPTQAKLVVNTTSLVASAFGRDGTDGDVVQIYNGLAGTTKVIALGASGNDGTIYSQYGDLLLQPTAGNVGIGTATPGTKLEVDGDIGIGRVAGGYTFRETVGGSERASIKSNATNELIFSYGASTEAMRIDDSGNVGIGTTSPDFKLDVDGTFGVSDLPGNGSSTSVLVQDQTTTPLTVVNGDFATDTSWSKGPGWTISGGKANVDGTQTATTYMNQSGILPNPPENIEYIIKYTISNYSAGAFQINVGGYTSSSPAQAANGTYEVKVTPTNASSNTLVYIQANADAIGSVDRISVKQVTAGTNQIKARELGRGVFDDTWAVTPTDSNNIYNLNSGNVGIGTTSPGATLELNSDTGNAAKLKIGRQNGATNYLELGTSGGSSVINAIGISGVNASLIFNRSTTTATTQSMIIDGSGNVGIGTTNPAGKFNSYISAARQLTHNGNGGDLSIISDNNNNPVMFIKGTGTAALLDIQGTQGQLFSVTDDLSGSIFAVADISGVPIFDVNSSGVSYFDGSLGIGTTPSSGTKLEVNGQTIINSTNVATGLAWFNNQTEIFSFEDNSGGGRLLLSDTTVKVAISANSDSYFNGGNVGIGTTSPDSKLDVTGGDITVNTSGVGFMNFKYGSVGSEAIMGSIQTTGIDLKINATSDLLLLPGSNVGIGITNPSAKLEVLGQDIEFYSGTGSQSLQLGRNANERLEMYVNDNMGKITAIQDADGNGTHDFILNRIFGGTGANNFMIQKDGSTQLLVDTNGNVGIGTTSPAYPLDVVGTANIDTIIAGNPGNLTIGLAGTKGTFLTGMMQTNYIMHCSGSASNLAFTNGNTNSNALTFSRGSISGTVASIGSISMTATSTSYNTTSDYRLKENEEKISNAIDRLKNLKPIRFNWILEPEEEKVDGFLAHEVAEVVPEAVTGEKDAIDYKGDDDLQMLENSKLVPLLTAALQQAIDKIELLEQRIQSIENK